MATTDRGLRALSRVQLLLAILFTGSFIVAVFVVGTPYPYRDDWDWLAWRLDGPITLDRLLASHNEHLPVLPRLIFLLQFAIEKSSNHLTTVASLAALLIVASLILNEARRHAWPSTAERAVAIGAGACVLFFNWQLQSMLFTNTVGFPLVELFVVTTIVCVLNATEAPARAPAWTIGAMGAAMAAMATTAAGLFAPLLAAAVAFGRRARTSVVVAFALLFAAGLGGYLLLRPTAAPPMPPASAAQTIALFFSFFASFAAYRWPALGIGVGMLMFGAGLTVLWPALRRSRSASRLEQCAAGLVMFTMLAAAAVASARAGFGTAQGAQSRYATFVFPYWCAIWLVLWDRVYRRDAVRVRQIVAGAAVLVTLALLPLHVLTAIVWRAKSDNVSAAALAVAAGVEDDSWLHTLHPHSEVVTHTVARLRAIGDPMWQLPQANARVDDVRALSACASGFLVLPMTRPGDYELLSSLAVDGDRGLVLDEQGRVIGVARRAPLVTATEPSHAEVIAAVLRELRHRAPRNWLGFAHSPAGAPAMVVVQRGSTSVCRASLSSG